jgi:hypothetical protein
MPATRCTCIRDGLSLLVADPVCAAPSHLADAINALELS